MAEMSSSSSTMEDGTDDAPCISEEEVPVPADISLNSIAVEICLHPSKDVLAVGTINGPVRIYSYTTESQRSNHRLMSFRHHRESCRAVKFSTTDDLLFTGSSDTTIGVIDLNQGAVSRKMTVDENAAAIYCLLPIDQYLLASGDDDGQLIVWDFRRATPIATFKESNEYISCMATSSDKRTLLATSGEGTLSAFNIRANKMEMQSEQFDSEFLTLAVLKNQTKVVCGAGDGTLNIFNWGEWGNFSDRFPCHDGSVDVITPISENVLCAGCEDGVIRAVQILPNKIIGSIGSHDELPVEGLSVSHDRKYIASCSYDQKIKFHALSIVRNIEDKIDEKKNKAKKRKLECPKANKSNFFSGLA